MCHAYALLHGERFNHHVGKLGKPCVITTYIAVSIILNISSYIAMLWQMCMHGGKGAWHNSACMFIIKLSVATNEEVNNLTS